MPESPRTDDRSRPPASRFGAAAAVSASVVVVVAVAVLAARSDGAGDDDTIPQAGVPASWIDATLGAVMLVGVVALVLIVVIQLRNREPGGGGPTMTNRYLLGALLLVAIIVAVRYLAGEPELPEPADPEEAPAGTEQGTDDDGDDESPALWPLLLALGVGAAAVGTIPLVRHLTARDEEDGPEDDAHQLARRRDRLIGLLDDAIDDLRRHPDPREAVIAAWARLEDAFELAGLERRASDTPLRLLARALDTVEASAPAVEGLTRAFEHAMFSTHRIDRATQLGAVDALVAVRDELHLHARRSMVGS